MPELMGVIEYAAYRGVSRVTIHNWTKKGLVTRTADGRIDVAPSDARLLEEAGLPVPERVPRVAVVARDGDAVCDPIAAPELRPPPLAAVDSVQETLTEVGEGIGQSAPDDLGGLNGAGVTLTDARKAKTVQDTHLTRLKVQQLRGDLVDRKAAESQAFAAGRLERDAWMAWPARVAPQMAADLRLDAREMHSVLEQYVREHLVELSGAQTMATD